MKKDLRTNEKKRARHERLGKSFASLERAEEIGNKHGAALVMECSSLEEAAGLKQIVRKVYDLAVDSTSTDRRTMRQRVNGTHESPGLLASVYQSCVLL